MRRTPRLDGDRCDLSAKRVDVERLDNDIAVVQSQSAHQPRVDELRSEPAGIRCSEPDPVCPVVHQVAEVAIVAARHETTLRDHEHVRPDPGDLVEHVARHEDAATFVAETMEQRDHATALHRVETGERFVENEHLAVR